MADLKLLESCAAWKLLGIKTIRNANGQIGVTIKNTPEMRQMHGTMHGGLIATVLDSAGGAAVAEAIGKDYVATTVELKVSYLLPVITDLTAYAEIVKKGKNLITTMIKAYDEQQNTVAIAIGTFMVKPMAK